MVIKQNMESYVNDTDTHSTPSLCQKCPRLREDDVNKMKPLTPPNEGSRELSMGNLEEGRLC